MNSLAALPFAAQRPTTFDAAQARRQNVDQQGVLANRLAERLGLKPEALKGNVGDYTPAKVADRVLGFIEQRLSTEAAAGADPQKLQGLLAQARQGVEQGFAEARKILDGMGLLQGQVASDLDDTYQRIQQGLNELAPSTAPEVAPELASQPASLALASYRERFAAVAETFDLAVTTRDGDRLRISVAQASASYSEQGMLAASDGQNSGVLAYQRSSSVQIGAFQISVEGELDQEEMTALSDLLKQVEGLSGSFYSGDMVGAFDRAMSLQMDGEQLASMSLQLTQTRVRQATDAYAAVAGNSAQPASAGNAALGDYARGLLEALNQVNELAEQGRGLLEQLLDGGFALDPRLNDAQLEKAGWLNRSLLDGFAALQQGAQSGLASQPQAA
ncbi:hypothetical protein HNP49_001109 [Pseudomonas fluvialis]|uniref:DUF5610 domain-containing protein n=1 Tax=Pseudomonas fluvialis TaxID=1793966 RepID=A0A7X0ER50_9PSED|nr:DUF5610 domain-containing protein [Pseudomonas fluvialis]MBB6340952.1 hypothetical protein [Pseudomonas fluvialis]